MNVSIRSRYAIAFALLIVWASSEPGTLRSIVMIFAIGLISWAMHDDEKLGEKS